ncbi:hypothetical protein JCM3774_003534 [Rhodotorula dairenensis]
MSTASIAFESEHVHAVYDHIAHDFSRTRHSPWPFVQHFLDRLSPPGALVLDAGTGNGKYLAARTPLPVHPTPPRADLLPIGFDRSQGLLAIASDRGHEVVRGDCIDLSCWRRGAFDHAISIATIHHFATPERRTEAVKQMILAVLAPNPPSSSSSSSSSSASATFSAAQPRRSRLLIVVWSLEQDPALVADDRSARRTRGGKKGAVPAPVPVPSGPEDALATETRNLSLNAGEDMRGGQDVFVPWARQNQVPRRQPTAANPGAAADPRPPPRAGKDSSSQPSTMARSPPPPTRADSSGAAAAVQQSDRGAATAPHSSPPTPPPQSQFKDQAKKEEQTAAAATTTPQTFQRYYHLFRQYELSQLVQTAATQLGLAFSRPESYPLPPPPPPPLSSPYLSGEWRAHVWLCEERWERENWVVEVEVGWERVQDQGGAPGSKWGAPDVE